jgi:uncharacterized RmlC-like cupin family protein
MSTNPISHWRDHGVKVIPGSQLDLNTPQTPGMTYPIRKSMQKRTKFLTASSCEAVRSQ